MSYCLRPSQEKRAWTASFSETLCLCGCYSSQVGAGGATDWHYASCEKVCLLHLHMGTEAERGQVAGAPEKKKVGSGFKSRSVSKVLTPAGNKGSWQLRLSEVLVLTRVLHPSSSSDRV